MSLTGRISHQISLGGVYLNSTISRSAAGQIGQDVAFIAPATGVLTTRSGDDSGLATLDPGHGLTTGCLANIAWDGGERRGVECTVAGNEITFSGGEGDNLPAEESDLEMARVVIVDTDWDADLMSMLAVLAEGSAANVVFLTVDPTEVLELDLVAGEAYPWASASNITNPLAGHVVDSVHVAAAYGGSAGTFKLGVIYDSD